jgi:hypothetical protein
LYTMITQLWQKKKRDIHNYVSLSQISRENDDRIIWLLFKETNDEPSPWNRVFFGFFFFLKGQIFNGWNLASTPNYVDEMVFSSVGQLLETGKNPHRLSGRFLGLFLTMVFRRNFKPRLWYIYITTVLKFFWRNKITGHKTARSRPVLSWKPFLPVLYQFITWYGWFSELSEIFVWKNQN